MMKENKKILTDLIIGCTTNYNWDILKYWVNSINKSGFDGDIVLITMNIDKYTCQKLHENGVNILLCGKEFDDGFEYSSKLPVHVERFVQIYSYLSDNIEKYRYVITTDVKDVIFQRNPVQYLHNALTYDRKYVFSSESMKYEDEPWGNQNLLDTFGTFFYDKFKSNEIFNVGVLAGYADAIRDLTAVIFNMSINRQIPIVDQSTFNFLISQEPYKSLALYTKSESGWACQLGTTVDESKIEEFRPKLLEPSPVCKDGVLYTSSGSKYFIVHQYDRCSFANEVRALYE